MFVHDADPLRDHLAPRRGVLQLLPLLRRPDGDVRLARRASASPRRRSPKGSRRPADCLEFLGWVAHGDRANLAGSNVADVAQSMIGVIEKVVFIVMILLSPMLTARFGKKAVAVVGFALMTIVSGLWYLPEPNQIWADGRADGARRDRLRADDSRAVVDVRRRRRLLGVEERPQRHRHRLRHDLLRPEGGPEPRLVLDAASCCGMYGYVAEPAADRPRHCDGIRLTSSVYPDDHVRRLHAAAWRSTRSTNG